MKLADLAVIKTVKGDKGSKGDHGEKGAVGNPGPGGNPVSIIYCVFFLFSRVIKAHITIYVN